MALRAAIDRALGLALPPRCPGCGTVADSDHRFCVACWSSLRFLGSPACAGCGIPFAHDRGREARCAACLARPPRHAGVHAAVAYGPVARTLALRLKYGGRAGFAETAARLMARLVPERASLVVPVPLHRGRLWSRGYNQAALIARALGRSACLPVEPLALVRHRATPMLRGLDRRERARAVAAAFSVVRPHAVGNHRIVLVDDVYTSGATADACTAALLRAGAASVTILCWARVVDPDGAD